MKEILKKIILENQNREINVKKRDLELPTIDKVISLIGLRRVGKTHLFFYKINELKKKGLKENIIYINFDDDRLYNFKVNNFQEILEAYYELYPNIDNKLYLFLDEIQNVQGWELFIRRLSENKEKYYIYLTGSSSKLLSKEISTHLRGRTLSFYLFPLSFKEYLRFNNLKLEKNYLYTNQRYEIKNLFNKYLIEGGFPEVINSDFKEQILQSYVDLIIYKDLIERYNLKNFTLLRNIIKYSCSNVSKLFSINSYYNSIKDNLKVSRDTIVEYVGYLNDINFLFFLPKFDYSLKNQNRSMNKVYLIDNGLANAISFKFSEDRGRLLENLVFIELKRRGKEIYYHKNKRECDFVIKDGFDIVEAIQVTKSLNEDFGDDTKKREFLGLIDALKTYNLKEGLILTEDEEFEVIVDEKGMEIRDSGREIRDKKFKIVVKPIWKWLLETED
jgi:hypothetical protein